jgi:scyllo-inositol 2-dehydrogenase (NADP+)
MVRTAVAGLGKMGLSHLAILRTHPHVNVVAVCDTFGLLLNALNKYTGLTIYSDFSRLLEKEQLDAVVIATPSQFHGQMVAQALQRRLHVFCEKPLCLNIAEGQSLTALAKAQGVVNQVGYHYRFLETFSEAKRLLNSGLIGRVHHIRAEAYGPVVLRPRGTTWRSKKVEGGGCLYDYACHAVDLVSFLHTTPNRVEGTIINKIFSTDVDDEVYATLGFPDGATGQLAANWSDESFRKMSMQITVWGTKGRMRIDRQEVQIYLTEAGDSRFRRGWNTLYTTELTKPVWFYLRGEEYSAQIDNFIGCIEDRSRPLVSSFATALETDMVLHNMIRDAAEDRAANSAGETQPTIKSKPSSKGRIAAMLTDLIHRPPSQ